jgi:two-component system heavy metal sensor histidine kinase CusS
MIRRALGNLLSNAIRHARTGSVVTTELSEGPGDRVLVAMTNVGDPIAEEHLPRLFDRFYRVDPARARASEGAGLGLAITKSIVEAHGGTISATSTAGTTRFAVELPVALPERSHTTSRPPAVTITEAGQAR